MRRRLSRALRQACEALSDVTDDPLGATRDQLRGGENGAPVRGSRLGRHRAAHRSSASFAHYVGPMARVMIRARRRADHRRRRALFAAGRNINDPVHRQRFFDEGGASGERRAARGSPARPPSNVPELMPRRWSRPSSIRTTMRLATYLGPIARVVANRAAPEGGDQDEFVQIIADHLGAQDRGAFLREIGFDG